MDDDIETAQAALEAVRRVRTRNELSATYPAQPTVSAQWEWRLSVLSAARQCALAGLSRSSFYYEPLGMKSPQNFRRIRFIRIS